MAFDAKIFRNFVGGEMISQNTLKPTRPYCVYRVFKTRRPRMRKFIITSLGLLLGLAAFWANRAAAAEPATQAIAPSDKAEWSETLNGLRVRLAAPNGTTCGDGKLLPLRVEVQNNTDKPIAYSNFWPMVRVLAHDEAGKWLGIPAIGPEIGDWATRSGDLAPGAITELNFYFQSLRFNRPLKVGERIQLQVSAPTQMQRTGKLPLEVNSPALSIRVESAFPQALADADVQKDWRMDFSCQVDVGLLGNQTVHVDPQGHATVLDNVQTNGQRSNKRVSAILPSRRVSELAAELRRIEVWKLCQINSEIGYPDEGSIRVALVSPSGHSLVGDFASHMESRQPVVSELRQLAQRLIADVETLAAGQPAGAIQQTPRLP
jgi:hypothetical protein